MAVIKVTKRKGFKLQKPNAPKGDFQEIVKNKFVFASYLICTKIT